MMVRSAPVMIALVVALAGGCAGDSESSGTSATEPGSEGAAAVAPAALIGETWQVRMADDAVRARFEGKAGWSSYFERDLGAALGGLGDEPLAQARVHLEHAALYRQALLMYAHATHFVYGERRQETDPREVDYLLGVSEVFRGEGEAAGAALSTLSEDVDPEIRERAVLWAGLAASPGWPLEVDAAAFPSPLPPPAAGQAPALTGLPHYQMAEQVEGSDTKTASSDPTTLYLLSRWHEQAARELAGDAHGALMDQLMAPWRLPAEPLPPTEIVAEVDDAWLFGGFVTHPADLAFVAQAAAEGAPAAAAWADRSPLAAAVAGAVEGGKVNPEKLLEQAAALEEQILAAMAAVSGGSQGYHRPFAAMAELGVLRAGAVAADASDQYRDAGLLRLNTMDASQGPLWDPVFVMSLAAWSAGNENTLRAQELVHQLASRFPGVEAARYPLDALHIRRGRDSVQLSPVH